jgi:hypothetical protein
MRTHQRRLHRGAIIGGTAATLAVLATGLIPVAAQVIGDPLGLISVGTSGESTSGTVLAVSNGGNAAGGTNGAGVSTSGTATGGLVAASGTGCAVTGPTYANAPVAVSGTGCAGGAGTTVSGTGSSCGTGLVGVSATGYSCGFVAASGTGRSLGAYSVDGDGEVRAEGQQISVWTGATVAPTPDQLQDPNYITQNTASATTLATKNQNIASIMPSVVKDLATMATSTSVTSPTTMTASSCNPDGSGCPGPYKVLSGSYPGGWWFEQMQQTDYTCGPAATNEVLSNLYNEADTESQIARLEKTSSNGGTVFDNARTTSNDLFKQHGSGYNYFSIEYVGTDMTKLMGLITWDVWYGPFNDGHGNGVILDVKPDTLSWWRSAGYHSPAGHYFSSFGYDHAGGGRLRIFDQFNWYALNHRSGTDPVYGEHWATLAEMKTAMDGGQPFGQILW